MILAVFALLAARLWYLQVTRGEYYFRASERNFIRKTETAAPRGIIFDRMGRPLVDNIPSFNLVVKTDYLQDTEALSRLLVLGFHLDPLFVQRKLEECKKTPGIADILLKPNLSFEECAFVEANRNTYPELAIDKKPDRRYLYGEQFCHIIGYTGEITEAELNKSENLKHAKGDIIGKSGLEKYYNSWLEGSKGFRRVAVNSVGQVTEVLEEQQPFIGKDMVLSIDLDIQRAAFEAMADKKGALVAMDPLTGEILAMVSNPGFDSNLFFGGMSAAQWKEIIENPDKPLQNKVTQGTYAPGSVFKILVALAGLKEHAIEPSTHFFCSGSFEIGSHVSHCWNKSGHGDVGLLQAIACSCNVYFYHTGILLGIDNLCKWANELGMGRKTGIDLPDEKSGVVPSTEWKKKRFGLPWYKGETVAAAIGQGYVSTTPLQICYFLSCAAINRIAPTPHVVRYASGAPSPAGGLLIDSRLHKLLVKGMLNVVEEGTGKFAQIEGVNVAGKTGTAQIISTSTAEKMADYKRLYRENSWFACFAPAEKPAITLAIIIEHGGHGGEAAAPIAAQVLRAYFQRNPAKVFKNED